ncbi:MAG: ComEC/Rec2 family competence protein, partial [Chloroflexota bacterium]|nr:ComEC/Rec2 family competence protein [Chloroflexota bacterium]
GTAGIIAWSSRLQARVAGAGSSGSFSQHLLTAIGESLAPTLAALVLVLPLLLYQFGTLSLIAPLANVLLAPAVPLAMLFGAIGAAAGLLALPLGQILALLAWPFTSWLIQGTHLLAGLPWAAFEVDPFGAAWVWGWYGLVAALGGCHLWRQRRRPP